MGRALKKINFMIEEEVYADLEMLVPSGKRSRVANEALRRELELIRRKNAVEKVILTKKGGKSLTNAEILAALSEDRRLH